jgi:hypothetical protein
VAETSGDVKELLVRSAATLAVAQDTNSRLCNLGAIFAPAASHDAPVCTDTAEGELEALYLQQRLTQGRINAMRPVVQGIRDARRGCVGREAAGTAAVLKLIKIQYAKAKVQMPVTLATVVSDVVAFAKRHFSLADTCELKLAYGDKDLLPLEATIVSAGVTNKSTIVATAKIPLSVVTVKRGKTVNEIEVDDSDTVGILKATVFDVFGIAVDKQRLTCNRKALDDDAALLIDAGVEEGCTVTLTAVKAVAPTSQTFLRAGIDLD